MPKLPRVSGERAIAALERLGFARARSRGSKGFRHLFSSCFEWQGRLERTHGGSRASSIPETVLNTDTFSDPGVDIRSTPEPNLGMLPQIPPWLSGLVAFGGALMSAFAPSVLPEKF